MQLLALNLLVFLFCSAFYSRVTKFLEVFFSSGMKFPFLVRVFLISHINFSYRHVFPFGLMFVGHHAQLKINAAICLHRVGIREKNIVS